MDTGGARLLRNARNQFLDLLAHYHKQVGKLVDHHHDIGQRLQFLRLRARRVIVGIEGRVLDRLAGIDGLPHLLVITGDIAHTQRRHQLVAAFHFANAPAQGIGGLFHIGHHRRQQVGDAFIYAQFQHFRIDKDQAHLIRLALEQQAHEQRIDADRLTRTGGTGHQQMRHFRQVGHHRVTGNVLAQTQGERRTGTVVLPGHEDFA